MLIFLCFYNVLLLLLFWKSRSIIIDFSGSGNCTTSYVKEDKMERINLQKKFSLFSEQWAPKIVAQVNEYQVKIARIEGDFPMHRHEETDELFFVVQGAIRMDFEDRQVPVAEGEMIVVPRGVLHRPHADAEARIMMFEPGGTLNTGDVTSEHTREDLERI